MWRLDANEQRRDVRLSIHYTAPRVGVRDAISYDKYCEAKAEAKSK